MVWNFELKIPPACVAEDLSNQGSVYHFLRLVHAISIEFVLDNCSYNREIASIVSLTTIRSDPQQGRKKISVLFSLIASHRFEPSLIIKFLFLHASSRYKLQLKTLYHSRDKDKPPKGNNM